MSAGNQLPTDTEVLFFALQIVHDPFKEIADEQPLFRAWRVAREARVTKAPDGKPCTVLGCSLSDP